MLDIHRSKAVKNAEKTVSGRPEDKEEGYVVIYNGGIKSPDLYWNYSGTEGKRLNFGRIFR